MRRETIWGPASGDHSATASPSVVTSGTPRAGIGALQLAAVRAALVPVALLGERLVDHPESGAFPFVFGAFAVWAVTMLGLRLAGRVPAAVERVESIVDLMAIVALVFTSGGPFSETSMAFFVLPILAAARLRPGVTLRWSAAAVVAYALLSVAHPSAGDEGATGRLLSQAGYLAWIGLAATLLSSALARRDAAIARLAEERGQLAAHALTAEQRERRRLAELLHDESVQTLSLARHELVDYQRTGREVSFERARAAIQETMAQLRGQIFELHPYVLDHAGLSAALRTIADRYAAGSEITVAIDPAAGGHHDELIVVVARELLANAAKHSGAAHVVVTVAADVERVELEVRDDGTGFDAARRSAALREGHIGLASAEQRVRAAGGELQVDSSPGRGTTVRVLLPLIVSHARPIRPTSTE
jgi:two-component system NarL family sensor kinase